MKEILTTHDRVLTVEEGSVVNGFGAYLVREVAEMEEGQGVRFSTMGLPDEYVHHGAREVLLREIDLDAQGIEAQVRKMV